MPNQNTVQLTAEGFKKLKDELNELQNVKRPRIVKQVAYAREQGDLSENTAYIQGREELNFIDGRIEELENIINQAKVINKQPSNKNVVELGNKVTVKIHDINGEHEFHVVGEWEADPKQKKVSPESPIGKALIGKKINETVEVEAPAGTVKYKILKIE